MKITKGFSAVPKGAIYPVEFKKGDECPPDLVDVAVALGAISRPRQKKKTQAQAQPEEAEE